ncbi:hypothetical protein [Wolbachia endosymbiont of Pentidionis agamae]|uniref:hypothetical protein n=1 Tax=Wolbachia endosymbiont of Pentidionis agamae TaxID=3110435 RepID=UPI002FD4B9D1
MVTITEITDNTSENLENIVEPPLNLSNNKTYKKISAVCSYVAFIGIVLSLYFITSLSLPLFGVIASGIFFFFASFLRFFIYLPYAVYKGGFSAINNKETRKEILMKVAFIPFVIGTGFALGILTSSLFTNLDLAATTIAIVDHPVLFQFLFPLSSLPVSVPVGLAIGFASNVLSIIPFVLVACCISAIVNKLTKENGRDPTTQIHDITSEQFKDQGRTAS